MLILLFVFLKDYAYFIWSFNINWFVFEFWKYVKYNKFISLNALIKLSNFLQKKKLSNFQ